MDLSHITHSLHLLSFLVLGQRQCSLELMLYTDWTLPGMADGADRRRLGEVRPVSYTHLTLPTILRV